MPTRPLPPCRAPGCFARSVAEGYCARHLAAARERERERKRRADDGRPSAAARGYGPAWRALRASFLRAHPRCCVCGQPATDVHHVIPRRAGGPDHWDNLAPLCHRCHARVTTTIEGAGWGARHRREQQ
jgi:5-methylcytosine-specific restriction protein A